MAKPFFKELKEVVNRNENILTDMGGLVRSGEAGKGCNGQIIEIPEAIEAIDRFLHECGPEKLLFATDFPVQTHADSVDFVENGMKDFSEKEKQMVYYENAAKLLGI